MEEEEEHCRYILRGLRFLSGIASSLSKTCCDDVRHDRYLGFDRHDGLGTNEYFPSKFAAQSVNDKRLLILCEMIKFIKAARVGNVAKVLELLPMSNISGTVKVGDLSSLTIFEYAN